MVASQSNLSLSLPQQRLRVLLLGSTGTIGRATLKALAARGHDVVCFLRPRQGKPPTARLEQTATIRFGDVTRATSLRDDAFCGETFDAVISCLASRTGSARDSQRIDYGANRLALAAAREAGVRQFILLSAICVQKPLLPFQQAKLAFEKELAESGLIYAIIRPTAFFKSLSGQFERVKRGKPFLVFGDGLLTACKPISDDDLAGYIADCLTDDSRWNRILPIGGPGEAITPMQQGELLFAALGRPPKFRHVPLGVLRAIQATLSFAGRFSPAMADRAELAKIGLYYASESMLVLNPVTGQYDADATPSTGTDTLAAHYARLVRGEVSDDRGDHAVF